MVWELFNAIRDKIDNNVPDAALNMIDDNRTELEEIAEHVVNLEALAYEKKRDLPKARKILEDFATTRKETFWIYFNLARICRDLSDIEASIRATQRAHAQCGWKNSQQNGYVLTHDYFSPNIANWSQWFAQLITASPIACLEIGSWQGGSSTWLLDNVIAPRGGSLTCIDTFEGSSEHLGFLHTLHAGLEDIFDANIARTGHGHLCRKLVGYSQHVLRQMQSEDFDFIFIDGAHEAKFVIQDAIYCWPMLRPGGFLLFDDYGFKFPGQEIQNTAQAIDFFVNTFSDEIEVLHQGWQVLVRKKTSPTSTWVDDLAQIRSVAQKGDLELAIDLCSRCLASHRGNADATAWANYHLFEYFLRRDGISKAAELAQSVIKSTVTMGAKFHVASLSIAHFLHSAAENEIVLITEALNDSVRNWLAGEQTASFDFPLLLAAQVSQQIKTIAPPCDVGLLAPKPVGDLAFDVKARLRPNTSHLRAPLLSNVVPGTLRYSLKTTVDTLPGLEITSYKNASLCKFGNDIGLFDSSGDFLAYPFQTIAPEFYETAFRRAYAKLPTAEIHVPNVAILISDQFNNNHNIAHWTLDWLARLAAADEAGIGYDCAVGTAALEHEFEKASLRRFMDITRFIALKNATVYRFEELLLVGNVGERLHHPCYNGNSELLTRLRNTIMKSQPSSRSRRLYVPRAHTRRVVNDNDVFGLLQCFGFEKIDTDAMSYDEQVRVFSEAEAIVGPHGAALTNLIFARENCKILELFPKYGGSAAYYHIATSMGCKYSCYTDRLSDPEFEAIESPTVVVNDVSFFFVETEFVREWVEQNFYSLN